MIAKSSNREWLLTRLMITIHQSWSRLSLSVKMCSRGYLKIRTMWPQFIARRAKVERV